MMYKHILEKDEGWWASVVCVWKMCICILKIVLTKCERVSARRAPRVFVFCRNIS